MQELFLNSDTEKKLYAYAKTLPVIDYHNHLPTAEIREDKRFDNLYDLWIKPDPYKHRAMRMCGVPEEYITGTADRFEKFLKWCETVPKLIGNPLSVWAGMELQAVFGIDVRPCKENAKEIYQFCNTYLKEHAVTPSTLFKQFHVELACPCMSISDPIDTVSDGMIPSLRCDTLFPPSQDLIKMLAGDSEIKSLSDFEQAVRVKLKEFSDRGCIFSDIALDNGFRFYHNDGQNGRRFEQILAGKALEGEEKTRFFSGLLEFLGERFSELGYVMQLHIGAERYTSTRLREKTGAAGGYAGIGSGVCVKSLTEFLDTLDQKESGLPKTILFPLNPADNAVFSTLSGSYARDGIRGLVTQGPAWWWCDHAYGIREMLENAAAFGTLSNFVGMTTDSRSFLSFVRHDYFRRILCGFLGEKFERNEFCCSYEDLEKLVYQMCYYNAKELLRRNEK